MKLEDFEHIEYYTPDEITATGAKLEDVQLETIQAADRFRALVGKRVHPLFNGITTGNHKSKEHEDGLAIDVWVEGHPSPYFVFKRALDAGFTRIGVYWNGVAYSFHLALGAKHGFWTAYKSDPDVKQWTYGRIIVDPAEML